MTESVHVFAFRSGAGRLCLDFIRTLRHRDSATEVEELADMTALNAWVDRFGPCPPASHTADRGQDAQARLLREAIYELVTVARGPAGAGSIPAATRETVNGMAALPVPAPRLEDSGLLHWQADDPVLATLALIAQDALDLVASPAIGRVRDCADPDCKAMFLDGSRPGSRRWCSMNVCGNKAKKAAAHGRAAGLRPPGR